MHEHAHPRPSAAGAAPGRLAAALRQISGPRLSAALAALWLASGIYVVRTEQQAVLTTFGALADDRVMPGVGWHWPRPVGQVYKLKVRELKRAFIGGELADEANALPADPALAQFLSGDQNILGVRAVAQYSIAEPARYLFRAAAVDRTVANAVEASLGRQISTRAVDEVLTTEKIAIQEAVRRHAQELIDRHELGVVVSTVNIRSVTPPAEAADAFRDVASARADAARIVNEAQGYANDLLPRGRGRAQQMLSAAQGYRERRIQQARGDAARFEKLAAEYARNPEVTRSRLFLETMEEILPRLRKTIVDENGNLDLHIVRRGSGRQAAP
ncbi:MAG: FtsH protease activity modulator HflK [Bryobacterales bacterium]|nr:FtsH protease activity modulator HflK [Bryobacterales bacterium]